ncbi:MAG TPA: BON domain-containing protein [Acidobacteriaceae bacterium]|nr:BON domain-containing protein [Acidobacteriaceae bacterium]
METDNLHHEGYILMHNRRGKSSVISFGLAVSLFAVSGCSRNPNDSQIAAQVKSQLAADSALQGQPITVTANHGVVTLEGTVPGQGSRELAGNDAARVKGVRTVLNNLSVGSAQQHGAFHDGRREGERNPNSGDAMMNGRPIRSYSSAPPPPPQSAAPPPGPAQPQQQTFVLPAGTKIRVRLAQTLSTKHSRTGDPFSGTVASPVQVNGETVIPAGANASGTVIQSKSQGRFAGQAVLAVRLDSIRVDGGTYQVQTSRVERIEKGKGERSAILAGGGAGLGALIGGLAGGGEGALIGGLVGGGGGAAGSAFTGSHDLLLPAESILTFDLDHSVAVQ